MVTCAKHIFTLLVFKTLGGGTSTGPYGFGSLGVSWQTSNDDVGTQSTAPHNKFNPQGSSATTIEGPEFMPMAWDPLKSNRESSILATILNGSGIHIHVHTLRTIHVHVKYIHASRLVCKLLPNSQIENALHLQCKIVHYTFIYMLHVHFVK